MHSWFVKKDQKDICADAGNLFLEYETVVEAEAAMAEMNNRVYDERTISLYYVPRNLYYANFQKDITPPQIIITKPKLPIVDKEKDKDKQKDKDK